MGVLQESLGFYWSLLPVGIQPTPGTGDTGCPCGLYTGHLHLPAQQERSSYPPVLRTQLGSYVRDRILSLCLPRIPPHCSALGSALSFQGFKAEKTHMERTNGMEERDVLWRREMSQSSFVFCLFNLPR